MTKGLTSPRARINEFARPRVRRSAGWLNESAKAYPENCSFDSASPRWHRHLFAMPMGDVFVSASLPLRSPRVVAQDEPGGVWIGALSQQRRGRTCG